MKVIFEFRDESEARIAMNGSKYLGILEDMDTSLRNYLKYGHEFKTADEAMGKIREELTDNCLSIGIRLHDEP
jgi:hypothetical protein